jgi:hypothetical protein
MGGRDEGDLTAEERATLADLPPAEVEAKLT